MPRSLLFPVLAIVLIHAQDGRGQRLDRFGDPLPAGALARLGTVRFHHASCSAYSPDGMIVATADSDAAYLWDAASGKLLRELPVEERRPAGLIFSHDGKKLAGIGFLGTSAQVRDLTTFKTILVVKLKGGHGGGDWSRAAAFSADDRTFFAAKASTMFVWDVVSGKKLKELPFEDKGKYGGGRMALDV
jgi:WD40 repeat protein